MTRREARKTILTEVERFFVGPISEDEMIEDSPWEFYHTGMLWPQGELLDADEDDQDMPTGMTDDPAEGMLNMANCHRQSAMGLSTQMQKQNQEIRIEVTWAEYRPLCHKHSERPVVKDRDGKARDHEPNAWQRECYVRNLEVSILASDEKRNETLLSVDGLELRLVQRITDDVIFITLVLINARKVEKKFIYQNIFYQSKVRLIASEVSPLVGRVNAGSKIDDEEFWMYELLYRHARQFAVGHGCSANWQEDIEPVLAVETEWIPRQKVTKASGDLPVRRDGKLSAPLFTHTEFLDLDFLSDVKNQRKIISSLRQLVTVYSDWILERAEEAGVIAGEFGRDEEKIKCAAQINLDECREQCRRIEAGINYIANPENDEAWGAFCLANQTIALGMDKARPGGKPRWRIFQLAFILIALPSTIEAGDAERDVLELIWFPTGGGKTEAYLGLSACLLFYRRLKRGPESAGTSVITRYTLRLLTIQQFERAAIMVCAANIVAARDPSRLGSVPFTIGLFVGGGATPNNLKQAEAILSGEAGSGQCTTLPVRKCPWCSSEIGEANQFIEQARVALVTKCSNHSCEFSDGLPISVVDEQIYNDPPSILIGTVDKFAMMPWFPKVKAVFGTPENRPDLIIQDELHLISDALGTVTALYETAVDYLTQSSDGPIKVIGSTATIRRADVHVRRLFNRKLAQFPPSGIDSSDSFFYQVDKDQDRLYVGLHAQGRSSKHSLARLVANVAQANEYIADDIKDEFYTAVMYFNSLRELGGALVLLEDDVPRYLNSLPLRDDESPRVLHHKEELTSQLNQQQLVEILERLAVGIGDDPDIEPVDAVLSTNMISVGVDIGRLNAMIINGQPKTTAEYIQASSRVGREANSAGVVFALYNWTRARDRSHYERFKAYHLAFYRHVESTSVTPFAARARDRALAAVLFAMGRLDVVNLQGDHQAGNILKPDIQASVDHMVNFIVERAKAVDRGEADATLDDLTDLIDDWQDFSRLSLEEGRERFFWRLDEPTRKVVKKRGEDLGEYEMLKWPHEYTEDARIKLPTSMRDVEPPTNIQILYKK